MRSCFGRLQKVLEKKGLLIEAEIKVEDIHRIGHIDAIVKTEDGLILYDFKTVHSRKFHHMRKEGGDRHYAMQALTYAMMLPFGVADVRIAYVSKDDLCIEEVSATEMVNAEEVIQDWLKLIQAWNTQTEPEPNNEEWECRYCIYRTACYNGSGGKK